MRYVRILPIAAVRIARYARPPMHALDRVSPAPLAGLSFFK